MCAWRGVEAPLWKPEHNDICFSSPTTQIPGAELRLSSLVTGTLNGSAILRTSTPLQGIYVSHPTCWANNLSSKSISVFRQKSELKHSLVRGLKGLFLQTDASGLRISPRASSHCKPGWLHSLQAQCGQPTEQKAGHTLP